MAQLNGHPYDPGRILHFDNDFPVPCCRIVRTFEGQSGQGFSCSCTVLVELIGELTPEFEGNRFVVLKAFDANFSAGLRTEFGLPSKTNEQHTARDWSSTTARTSFQTRFRELLDEETLSNHLLQHLITKKHLPARPRWGDLFRISLYRPAVLEQMVDYRLLEPLSEIEAEWTLQEICNMNFEHEKGIFRMTHHDPTRTLPTLFSSSYLKLSTRPTDPDGCYSFALDCPALLMEYIEGETLTQWLSKNQWRLQLNKSALVDNILVQEVQEICSGCFIANSIPLILGLYPRDIRTDNHQVVVDQATGRIRVRLIDAGGLAIVLSVMKSDSDYWLGNKNNDLAADFYYGVQYFHFSADKNMQDMLQEVFDPYPYIERKICWSELTLDIFSEHEGPLDTLVWQCLRFGLWQRSQTDYAARVVRSTAEVLHRAREIMRQSVAQLPRRYRGWIMVQRICLAFYDEIPFLALQQFAKSIYAFISSLEQDGITDLEAYRVQHPECIQQIVEGIPFFTQRGWQQFEDDLDAVRLWAALHLRLSRNEVFATKEIDVLLQHLYDEFPIPRTLAQLGNDEQLQPSQPKPAIISPPTSTSSLEGVTSMVISGYKANTVSFNC